MKNFIVLLGGVLGSMAVFCATNGEKESSSILQSNVEALASGEMGGELACLGVGSVDCPGVNVKVQVVYDR